MEKQVTVVAKISSFININDWFLTKKEYRETSALEILSSMPPYRLTPEKQKSVDTSGEEVTIFVPTQLFKERVLPFFPSFISMNSGTVLILDGYPKAVGNKVITFLEKYMEQAHLGTAKFRYEQVKKDYEIENKVNEVNDFVKRKDGIVVDLIKEDWSTYFENRYPILIEREREAQQFVDEYQNKLGMKSNSSSNLIM